jgi:hypothetical protein
MRPLSPVAAEWLRAGAVAAQCRAVALSFRHPRMSHPCQSCGACCAAYRVGFHWSEAEPAAGGNGVPAEMTEVLDPFRLAMRGTWARQPHCVALDGEVGAQVGCRIYARRPSPCRELQASWEDGTPSPQCDRARAKHGLAPLTPADWMARQQVVETCD